MFLEKMNSKAKLLFKLGSKGSAMGWISGDGKFECLKVPCESFDVHKSFSLVDTTGAGDTFTAAYAVNMAQQRKTSDSVDERAAMQFATKAAFICISRFGALPSIPTAQEVADLK